MQQLFGNTAQSNPPQPPPKPAIQIPKGVALMLGSLGIDPENIQNTLSGFSDGLRDTTLQILQHINNRFDSQDATLKLIVQQQSELTAKFVTATANMQDLVSKLESMSRLVASGDVVTARPDATQQDSTTGGAD